MQSDCKMRLIPERLGAMQNGPNRARLSTLSITGNTTIVLATWIGRWITPTPEQATMRWKRL